MTRRADYLVGSALSVVIVAVPLTEVAPAANLLAGGAALVVLVGSLPRLGRVNRLVALILCGAGVAALVAAIAAGARPDPQSLLSVNQGVVGMLAAVSFTRLVTDRQHGVPARSRGPTAVWRTAGVVHGLGSVINLAAVDLVGGHLSRGRGRLPMLDGLLLSRSFSTAAFWSPFWAASATAFVYAPRANPGVLMLCGALLTCLTLGISLYLLQRTYPDDVRVYRGYAVAPPALALPIGLFGCVLVGHRLKPDVPVSTVVLLSALGVSLLLSCLLYRRRLPPALGRHLVHGLPGMRGEATLFAAAGVLSVGLSALVTEVDLNIPISDFTPATAWVAIVAMVAVSLIGVHPVISIAIAAALLRPADPDPTLFALAAVLAWGASAAVGPISGLNVYLAGRFGLDGLAMTRHNASHLVIVLALALPTLLLGQWLTSR